MYSCRSLILEQLSETVEHMLLKEQTLLAKLT